MNRGKLSLFMLTLVFAISLMISCLIFGIHNTNMVKADGSDIVCVIGQGNWATESAGTISTLNPTFDGSLSNGNYYGKVYQGDTVLNVKVNKQETSEGVFRINFNLSDVDEYTEILNFSISKDEIFTNASGTESFVLQKIIM